MPCGRRSEPSLDGPGPHELCTAEPLAVSVQVTTSATGAEFEMPALHGEATVTIDAPAACAGPDASALDCDCRPGDGAPLLDAPVFNSPEAGTTFRVCSGNPEVRETFTLWYVNPNAVGSHEFVLHVGDIFDIPLLSSIAPGDLLSLNWGLSSTSDEELGFFGVGGGCDDPGQRVGNFGSVCANINSGSQPFTHLRVRAPASGETILWNLGAQNVPCTE